MRNLTTDRAINSDIPDNDAFLEAEDYKHISSWRADTPETQSTGGEEYEQVLASPLAATPDPSNLSQHTRQRTSHLEAEILDLKLKLIKTEIERDNAVIELELATTALVNSRAEVFEMDKEITVMGHDLGSFRLEVDDLTRQLKKKEPLFQVGVAVRLGFMDAANRVRIKGNVSIISQDLHADQSILQAKTDACHRGNMVADASLFDPELEIRSARDQIRTFNYLYNANPSWPADTPQRSRSSSFDATQTTISLSNADVSFLDTEPHVANYDDLRKFQACSDAIVSHPKLLEVRNIKASMIAYHSWTKYSHSKKADERFRKLERKAAKLIERWEEEYGIEDGGTNVQSKREQLDALLKAMSAILKETVKKEHGRLQGRRGR
ncbi:uncharacterized protein LY89DRAFT_785593 [Mollisia scopiformis]|uniref:Uncharacterized protein n=1 Tax=Mollisia scopiformis TaxID=149040 RepID=A0A194WYQ8_MOLSC|nr:uncharacterized protein LY89DRAFT_785593 [Mollisia scopiformis]KUJ13080.1 hypothetical protein LY89DRAFT_785593 [Mollisia scopiformis]